MSDNETFCSWSQDAAFSQTTLQTRIAQGLWVDSTSYEWEGMAAGKVDFTYYSQPCTSLSASTRASTEFEYTVKANTVSLCGGSGTGVSCAGLGGYFFNSAVGHGDYNKGYVTFKTAHLSGSSALYHHVVNHESGHILGFCDPGASGCATTGCPGSVMHSAYYGCTDLQFPSAGDIWVGTTIADDNVPEN